MNKKGSILQVVLILFMLLLSALLSRQATLSLSMKNYQKIEMIMKQKNLEIVLCDYYLDMLENDILMDDCFEYDDYKISYTYLDKGGYQLITTTVSNRILTYQFEIKVANDHKSFMSYNYKGEV